MTKDKRKLIDDIQHLCFNESIVCTTLLTLSLIFKRKGSAELATFGLLFSATVYVVLDFYKNKNNKHV